MSSQGLSGEGGYTGHQVDGPPESNQPSARQLPMSTAADTTTIAPGNTSPDLPTFRSVETNEGFWRRLLAGSIDSVIFVVAFVGVLLLIFVSALKPPGGTAIAVMGQLVLAVALFYLAIPLMWWIWGATPGKAMMGMKVVHAETGETLSFWHAVGRYTAYFPSFCLFGLGFVWIGWDPKKQGWHDKIANTCVVRRELVVREVAPQ